MHRPARWPSPRKFLEVCLFRKKKTPALLASGVNHLRVAVYLLVEQVLEIIFTLLTVNVDCVPEEEPAPVAPAPLLGLVELGLEELGLEELGLLEPEADALLSVPMRRT